MKDIKQLEDKLKLFFSKLSFLELDSQWKAEVAKKVKYNALADKLYWIEIILSAGIATLGLLQNSVAVVIWAMLIAPLLRPINGISFAISTWEQAFFSKVLKVLILSIIYSILMGYILSFLIWIKLETSEILARVNPTLIDLFVAIFSAIVAVLSLRFSRLTESIAGVAIAAALMPPLAVVWIELYLEHIEKAFGAFMLFLTNLVAIIIIWTGVFWFMWFYPHRILQHKLVVKRIFFVVFTFIIILIPLFHSLFLIKQKYNIVKDMKKIIVDVFSGKVENFKIDNLKITDLSDKEINFYLALKLPEDVSFYKEFEQELIERVSKHFNRKINIDIDIFRIAKLISKKDEKVDFISLYKSKLYNFFAKNNSIFNLVQLDIQKVDDIYIVKIVGVFSQINIDEDKFKKEMEEKIKNILNLNKVKFIWIFLPSYSFIDNFEVKKRENKENEKDNFSRKVYYIWKVLLDEVFSWDIFINNLKVWYTFDSGYNNLVLSGIKSYDVSFDIYLPYNFSWFDINKNLYRINKYFTWINIRYNIKEFRYKNYKLNFDILNNSWSIINTWDINNLKK